MCVCSSSGRCLFHSAFIGVYFIFISLILVSARNSGSFRLAHKCNLIRNQTLSSCAAALYGHFYSYLFLVGAYVFVLLCILNLFIFFLHFFRSWVISSFFHHSMNLHQLLFALQSLMNHCRTERPELTFARRFEKSLEPVTSDPAITDLWVVV